MSKSLRPIPIHRLLEHIARELEMSATVFSVPPGFRGGTALPLALAAGPGTRMAQSLAAAYVAGARAFELTAISREETGLDRGGLLGEAIKGHVLIQMLDRELGLGSPGGAEFAVEVPAEPDALAGEEMAAFFAALEDASQTPLWQECRRAAQGALGRFNDLKKSDVEALDPHISHTAILDWAGAREALEPCARLLLERGWDVYIKLDPTALGPIGMGGCLAAQGGEDLALDKGAFGPDLAWLGPVLDRLGERAGEMGRVLGLRVAGSVPLAGGGALDGRAAAPLHLLLCARAAARWPGLPVVWAGWTDNENVGPLCRLGFRAVAAGESLRRPGGLLRLRQMARAAAGAARTDGVDAREAEDMARAWSRRARCRVDQRAPSRGRIPGKAPLTDCFTAPCQGGCPFGMDIAGALRLMSDGRYRDALGVILDKNPLPHLTGAVCPQPCAGRCTRIFYDQAVQVRQAEALCAQRAWADLLPRLEPELPRTGARVAVVGAGPGGMAAAFLLARRGVAVTLFDVSPAFCPALRRDEPELGAPADLDGQLLAVMGVDLRLGAPAPGPQALLDGGYSHVILALEGADDPDQLRLAGAEGDGEMDRAQGEGRVLLLPRPGEAEGGIAQAIADAHALAEGILGPAQPCSHPAGRRGGAMGKKGKVCPAGSEEEWERCLECATVCECCVDACPNRANVPITVPTRPTAQILHLDALCDHCGVCGAYCPYESAPDRDKLTLFETAADFDGSESPGFVVLDFLARKVRLRLEGEVRDLSLKDLDRAIPGPVREMMETVFTDYPYLLDAQRRKATDQVSLWEQ